MPDDQQPTPKPAPDQGQAEPVDTKVQEDAAKERAENGGYD